MLRKRISECSESTEWETPHNCEARQASLLSKMRNRTASEHWLQTLARLWPLSCCEVESCWFNY